MDTIKKILRFSNIGTIIFCTLNLALIIYVFTAGYEDFTYMPVIIIFYILTIIISLSPIGEWFLGILVGARPMKRKDMKIRMIPLLEIVYNKAKKKSKHMVNSINLKVIYDPSANAYAIGRKTICVTTGLFQLSDECIIGILAHEVGHIANRHSEIQVLIGSANLFISVILLALKIISWIITGACSIFAFNSRNAIATFILVLTGVISSLSIWLWTKICMIFLMISSRMNEYVADKYAYEIGFGLGLAKALEIIEGEQLPQNGLIRALYHSHPNYNERIAKLQELGVNYYAY